MTRALESAARPDTVHLLVAPGPQRPVPAARGTGAGAHLTPKPRPPSAAGRATTARLARSARVDAPRAMSATVVPTGRRPPARAEHAPTARPAPSALGAIVPRAASALPVTNGPAGRIVPRVTTVRSVMTVLDGSTAPLGQTVHDGRTAPRAASGPTAIVPSVLPGSTAPRAPSVPAGTTARDALRAVRSATSGLGTATIDPPAATTIAPRDATTTAATDPSARSATTVAPSAPSARHSSRTSSFRGLRRRPSRPTPVLA